MEGTGAFRRRSLRLKVTRALLLARFLRIAIGAGIEALKQGGSATDAAATVALTQVTSGTGI